MPPQDDPERRVLFPPSTAATLNLAATAAQCARIWRGIDPAFSARCLDAAKRAFTAAEAHPDVYPVADFTGSGGFGDATPADEFYSAAAELFLPTGAPPHRAANETGSTPGWGKECPYASICAVAFSFTKKKQTSITSI